jgi:thiol-disulfide isomerase/thioredoxin
METGWMARIRPNRAVWPAALLAASLLLSGCPRTDIPWSGSSEPLPVGSQAPVLTAGDWINPRPPDDLQGHVVLVDVFATWCGPCRAATPGLVQLYQQLQEDHPDLIFMSLTAEGSDDRPAINQFVDDFGIPWAVGFNAQQSLLDLGAQGYPTVFVIGRDGRIAYVEQGYTGSHREIEQALEAALHADQQQA